MVPFLVVVLRVIRSSDGEDRRLTAGEATKCVSIIVDEQGVVLT
jgi:phosphate transporter